MMKQIEEQGLLKYFPRQGLELTAKGKTLGLRMIRRHRLIETFLVDKLDYDWADVHDEAEALEHAVSSKFIEKLDELLDHPNYDPHGDPIPNALGDWEHRDLISLSQCNQGAQVVIARILDEGHSLLDYLKNSGLVPGAVWVISRVLNGADTLEITSEELHRKEVMAKSTAEKIMVEKL
jgi:DtxR family Mn-dependent transcriptional regulator